MTERDSVTHFWRDPSGLAPLVNQIGELKQALPTPTQLCTSIALTIADCRRIALGHLVGKGARYGHTHEIACALDCVSRSQRS